MPGKSVRVGAIGCGNIFSFEHMPVYPEIDNARLIAFYDSNPANAEKAKKHYAEILKRLIDEKPAMPRIASFWESRFVPSDELLQDFEENITELEVCSKPEDLIEKVDIVDVCTPPRWHPEYAIMALERGVNAMTEKPMGRTWWEARKVRDAVSKSKALFQHNDDNVFHPRFQIFKNVVEEGVLGEIKNVTLHRGSNKGPEWSSWFWNPEISGGGALMDYGTHAVTAGWYLIGFDKKPLKAKSDCIKKSYKHRIIEGRLQEINVEDDAHIRVLFENPENGNWITASIEATWSRPLVGVGSDNSGFVEIEGTEGTISGYRDENGNDVIKVAKTGYGERAIPLPKIEEGDVMRNEIGNFVKSVQHNQPSLCNENVGIGTMEILGSAYLSEAENRKTVSIEEFREFCLELGNKNPDEAPSNIIRHLMRPYQSS